MLKNCMITVLFLVIWLCSPAGAAVYYVSESSGSDINSGTSGDEAWRTIQKAANSVNAGDTVHVLAGTYNESVTLSISGTIDNPITFQGVDNPIITNGSAPIIISGSYIAITGFNITAVGIATPGVRFMYNSGAKGLNISSNYIKTDGGEGILLNENAGHNSVISTNEIHTGYRAGIALLSTIVSLENIDILNNIIYADENFMHRDYTDASGIWTYWPSSTSAYYRNIRVINNKIVTSGYTGIKISGGIGCKINYNEIFPKGFAHNAIELGAAEDSEYVGNIVHDMDMSWVVQGNAFYSAGSAWNYRKNLKLKDDVSQNNYGRALTIGGLEHHFIVENFKAINHHGRGIQLGDLVPPASPVRVTGNGIFKDTSLDLSSGEIPVLIISLGEATSLNHADWNAYKPADVTFINTNIIGTYSQPTWILDSNETGAENHHFEGTIYVINSNKNDVSIIKNTEGTFNGSIIFYYYLAVKVIDVNGNPIDGAKVSFLASDPAIRAKNTNYTYVPFPDGKTQDIDYTYTGVNGHTPLPSNASETAAIADFKQTITGTTYYSWTLTAQKNGYTNSTTVNPDSSWYRTNPDTYQNTITIVLPFSQPLGNVSGAVIDNTGSPITGASVSDGWKTTTTDGLGKYVLDNLPAGDRSITVSMSGYKSYTKQATIIEGTTVSADFQLFPGISSATIPSAPQGLTALGHNNQILLSWQAPASNGGSAVTNNNIYRWITGGAKTLLTQIGDMLSYTDINVENGVKYYYNISALNSAGESTKSNEANATALNEAAMINAQKPYAYPVPYVKGKHSTITFSNLTRPSKLEIYTVDGTLIYEKEITEFSHSFVPDGFSSGVYMYLIRNSKGTSTGKVVIIK